MLRVEVVMKIFCNKCGKTFEVLKGNYRNFNIGDTREMHSVVVLLVCPNCKNKVEVL